MNQSILHGMRGEASEHLASLLRQAEQSRLTIAQSMGLDAEGKGGLQRSLRVNRGYLVIALLVCLALVCAFGAEDMLRGLFPGYLRWRDAALARETHQLACLAAGAYLLALAWHRLRALRVEKSKDGLLERADNLIEAIKQKMLAVNTAEPAAYPAAAGTSVRVMPELAALKLAGTGLQETGKSPGIRLRLFYWIGLLGYTTGLFVIISGHYRARIQEPVTFGMLGYTLCLYLSIRLRSDRVETSLPLSLLPFASIGIAYVAAVNLLPLISFIAAIYLVYLLYKFVQRERAARE